MKGSAKSEPRNHVKWANGFESNMPDFQTARKCAAVDELLIWAKEARTVLFSIERPESFNDPYDREKCARTLTNLDLAIANAEYGPANPLNQNQAGIPVKAFPKPPGI